MFVDYADIKQGREMVNFTDDDLREEILEFQKDWGSNTYFCKFFKTKDIKGVFACCDGELERNDPSDDLVIYYSYDRAKASKERHLYFYNYSIWGNTQEGISYKSDPVAYLSGDFNEPRAWEFCVRAFPKESLYSKEPWE